MAVAVWCSSQSRPMVFCAVKIQFIVHALLKVGKQRSRVNAVALLPPSPLFMVFIALLTLVKMNASVNVV